MSNIMYKLNSDLLWTSLYHFYFIPFFTWIVIYMGLKPKYTYMYMLYSVFWKYYKIVPHVQMQTADNSKAHFLELFCIILKMHVLTFKPHLL